MGKILLCLLFLSPIIVLVKPTRSADAFNLIKRTPFGPPWTLLPHAAHNAKDYLKPGLKFGNTRKMTVEELIGYLGRYQRKYNFKRPLLPQVIISLLYDF